MTLFKGSGVAVITPFHENGDINYEDMERLIEFHVENKTDALIVAGTTGEASTLTDEEQRDLVAFSVKRAAGRVPIIAGAGSNDTRHGVNLSKMCEDAGADGLLHVTPYYNRTSQKGLVEHFGRMAEAVDIPIILYDVPSRTGMQIAPETVLELSKIDNIVGLKDATANLSYTCKVRELCGPDFSFYSGNDDIILPVLSLGGDGVISVWANVFPREVHDMCQAFFQGDLDKAIEIQTRFKTFIDSLFIESNPIPLKACMEMMKMDSGNMRLPLIRAQESTYAKVRESLEALGVL